MDIEKVRWENEVVSLGLGNQTNRWVDLEDDIDMDSMTTITNLWQDREEASLAWTTSNISLWVNNLSVFNSKKLS